MGYAFISYSTKNQAMADAIRNTFTANKIDTWMAPYSIPPGSKYAQSITNAIRNCSCFVLLLSNASQSSEAVDSEVELAALTFKKSIVTVQIEDVVLNDAFTFYIHNKQILPIENVDVSTPAMQAVLSTVISFAGQTLTTPPTTQQNVFASANATQPPRPAANNTNNAGASPYAGRPTPPPPPQQPTNARPYNNNFGGQPNGGFSTAGQRPTPPMQNYPHPNTAPKKQITFGEAIKSYFINYANFSGRATVNEYWFAFLFSFVLNMFTIAIPGIGALVGLVLFIPSLSITVRRLHDTGKAWTFMLVSLIPFLGAIILLIQFCQPSGPDNRWGPAIRK